MDFESVKETAVATQEMIKTAKKGLEVAEKVGGFIAHHVGGSLEQGMGIFEDKLKYFRATRQLRYISKFNELADELNIRLSMKPIPMKLAIPLFEAASLEDDDYLQDLWVKLLLNASDEQNNINLQRSHINILEQLTSFEAKILETIYGADLSDPNKIAVLTHLLPDKVEVVKERAINQSEINPVDPNDEIKLALSNLARLRCIALPMVFGGGELYTYVNPTLLGQRFINACTIFL